MPLFEYVCHSCSHAFEALVREPREAHCPACDGTDLERRFSVFAAHTGGTQTRDAAPAACGACGDHRGPGACSLN